MTFPRAAELAEAICRCILTEYPHKLDHLMLCEGDARSPRQLHPSFYGSYDWHSAVHCCWSLVRISSQFELSSDVWQTLESVFREASLARECEYLVQCGHKSFERPYGLAWLLKLASELRNSPHSVHQRWHSNLLPLTAMVEERFCEYLRIFDYPVRVGTHANSAFAMSLALEYAAGAGRNELIGLVQSRARSYFMEDRGYAVWMEPCGGDFLSPALAEADLMTRVLSSEEFVPWFDGFLPDVSKLCSLPKVFDPTDPAVIHLRGLYLSKAWCLYRICQSLPTNHGARVQMLESAERHAIEGQLHAVTGFFLGDHWLPSFAVYLDSVRSRNDALS